MNRAPAHDDLIALAQSRLAPASGAPVISYIGGSEQGQSQGRTATLKGYQTNFRNSPEATRRTIELMRGLVWGAVGTPIIHRAAGQVRKIANAQNISLSSAIHQWTKLNLVYRPDEELLEQGTEGRELLIAPNLLLAMNPAEGDCDDFSMVSACLAVSLGMKAKFIAVATEQDNPGRYSHIYIAVLDWVALGQQEWIPLDCSHGKWPGWETERQFLRYEAPV